jgi:hypothetical protein
MPALTTFGGALAGQVASGAGSAAGGTVFQGIGQWANYYCQNGIVPYEHGRLLYQLGWLSHTQFSEFRRFQGIEGNDPLPSQIRVSEWNDIQQRANINLLHLQQELHVYSGNFVSIE